MIKKVRTLKKYNYIYFKDIITIRKSIDVKKEIEIKLKQWRWRTL